MGKDHFQQKWLVKGPFQEYLYGAVHWFEVFMDNYPHQSWSPPSCRALHNWVTLEGTTHMQWYQIGVSGQACGMTWKTMSQIVTFPPFAPSALCLPSSYYTSTFLPSVGG